MDYSGFTIKVSPVKTPSPPTPVESSDDNSLPIITSELYNCLDRLLEDKAPDVEKGKEFKRITLKLLKRSDTHSIIPMALDFTNDRRLLHLDIMISNELFDMDVFLATYFAVSLNLKCSLKELRKFFEYEFSYSAYRSPTGAFVNRVYIIQNYAKFLQLPMKCRHFIFKCMMSAPTNEHYVDLMPNWINPYPKDEGPAPTVVATLDKVLEKEIDDPERLDFLEIIMDAVDNDLYPEAVMIETVLRSNMMSLPNVQELNGELGYSDSNGLMLLFLVYRMNRVQDNALTLEHLQSILMKLKRRFQFLLSSRCEGKDGFPINRTFYHENPQFFEALPEAAFDFFATTAIEVATTRRHRNLVPFDDSHFVNGKRHDVRDFTFL